MSSPAPKKPPKVAPSVHPEEGLQDVALHRFRTSTLPQLLEMDNRPTFVLDIHNHPSGTENPIRPVFCNFALRRQEQLLSQVIGIESHDLEYSHGATYNEFRTWATMTSNFQDSRDILPLTIEFANFIWTSFSIRPNWKLITGHSIFRDEDSTQKDSLPTPATRLPKKEHGVLTTNLRKALASAATISTREIIGDALQPKFPQVAIGPDKEKDNRPTVTAVKLSTPKDAVPDWTVPHPKGRLSEHIKFVRSIDWGKTPLGPMNDWSVQFRELVCLVMRNPQPSSIFWGEDMTMLYNEAYRDGIAGDKHPALMGTGFTGPFHEMWDAVSPIVHHCARTGNAILNVNLQLPIMRYGYLEEGFFTWSFVPVFGGTERILGFYMDAFDTTIESVSSRRMELLRYLGERMNATRTVKEFWGIVLEGLSHNEYDVPFALLYSIADSDGPEKSSSKSPNASPSSEKTCVIEGSIGIPKGRQSCPDKFVLEESNDVLVSAFLEATQTLEPKMLSVQKGNLPRSLLKSVEWRGHKDPSKEAVILPLQPTNAENICALLLLGINPRRAYDQEYETFIGMLNRQIASSLASVLLFEDEVRRSKHAAEVATMQREMLSQQLQLQTSRMRRMTEFSPQGMFLFDVEGRLLEANERYFEMTGATHDHLGKVWYPDMLTEASQKVSLDQWTEIVTTLKPVTCELQFKKSKSNIKDIDGEPIEYWVLRSSQPELSADGKLVSIMGSITDISHFKWAQGLQERRLKEAEEAKRQQNEFIDITSHEMRNPLSAILICADDIRDTLALHDFSCEEDKDVANDCIEAAKNIALCVQHQKSIVDDILTVSKLDSNLLRMSPIPSQPIAVIERSMTMFRPETEVKDIDFTFEQHRSLRELDIDWVLLDSGRVLQIIVNLITNAIKFTRDRYVRSITVHVSARTGTPDFEVPKGFDFVPQRVKMSDFGNGEDWGSGEPLFLLFQVRDTGCGLTPAQKKLLFEKFAQASPRTHCKYGGSGLGLFISRRLAELHGGQIGCASEAGVGSTFGFYLKCKRIMPQDVALPDDRPQTPLAADYAASPRKAQRSSPKAGGRQRLKSIARPLSSQSSYQDPPLHVLVVEDNHLNQRLLCKQLTKAGCIVSTADNGVHALEHLANTHFCTTDGLPLTIILMDCEMPEMDGLTCCKRIREMEQRKQVNGHVPVIAVTANVRGAQIDEARASGMDDVIGKPFRMPELLAKISGLLKRLEEG